MSASVELVKIYERDGSLTPEAVLDEATSPNSPLHDYFVWDDTEAARRFRLLQAGYMIRHCRINIETAPATLRRVRQFVSIPNVLGVREYVAIVEAMSDERRDVVMEQAVRDLTAIRRKYEALVDIDKAWVTARKRRRRTAA